ncbi:hypothetical protein NE237_024245 [Protea cynaroides]|uniref:Uncharacterized protein n=1 Tax=Protea cynaroides TaxID=273540 RepID=A0A9Q0K5Z2_9MAGN|nr:hypothetical protein NE237_024245 [Protea cynaroides]
MVDLKLGGDVVQSVVKSMVNSEFKNATLKARKIVFSLGVHLYSQGSMVGPVTTVVHRGFSRRLPCHQVTNFLDLPTLGRR